MPCADGKLPINPFRPSNFLGETRQYYSLANLAQSARTQTKALGSSELNNQEKNKRLQFLVGRETTSCTKPGYHDKLTWTTQSRHSHPLLAE